MATRLNILVTGASGFVGQQIVHGLLRQVPDSHLWLLIRRNPRGGPRAEPQIRFESLSEEAAMALNLPKKHLQERLHLVIGDIESPQLGLQEVKREELAESINCIYHTAANINLHQTLPKARQSIVGSTQSVCEFAQLAAKKGDGFWRLNYLSTAFVAGKRTTTIFEEDLDKGQSFNNGYEQAKMEAEKVVRASMSDLPITVFRPSIIMGDSQTGWTKSFNFLYGLIKLGYAGKIPRIVPGCARSRIDTVPIDYVTGAILHLSSLQKEVIGKTFHLTVGVGRTVTVKAFIEMATPYYALLEPLGIENPRIVPTMIHPRMFRALNWLAIQLTRGARRKIFQNFKTYTDYSLSYKEFNDDQARALLAPQGIRCPPLREYLGALCKFYVDTMYGGEKARQKPALEEILEETG